MQAANPPTSMTSRISRSSTLMSRLWARIFQTTRSRLDARPVDGRHRPPVDVLWPAPHALPGHGHLAGEGAAEAAFTIPREGYIGVGRTESLTREPTWPALLWIVRHGQSAANVIAERAESA